MNIQKPQIGDTDPGLMFSAAYQAHPEAGSDVKRAIKDSHYCRQAAEPGTGFGEQLTGEYYW